MAQEYTVPQIITFAKNSQVLAGLKIVQQDTFKGGALSPQYSNTLYLIRKSVEFVQNAVPSTSTLRQTAEFLYALVRPFGPLVPPATITISNPSNQSTVVGGSATFCVTVSVSTGAAYTIQWFKNGVLIPGATSGCYTQTNALLADNGATYNAIAMTAGLPQAVSATATITVTAAALAGFFTYSPTVDFYPILLTSSDPFSYPTTFPITHNTPIPITLPPAMPANQFMLAKIPIGESVKTGWSNTPLNNGTIPDTAFEAIVQFGGFTYYASRGQISMDVTQTLILT